MFSSSFLPPLFLYTQKEANTHLGLHDIRKVELQTSKTEGYLQSLQIFWCDTGIGCFLHGLQGLFPNYSSLSVAQPPTPVCPIQFKAINKTGLACCVQIKSRWEAERAHDVFGFRPESHATDSEIHPCLNLRSSIFVWTTTSDDM